MTADVLRSRVAAIAQAHAQWKARLSTAPTLGAGIFKAEDAARDDRCKCGQLLHGMGSQRASPRWEHARDHHAAFHREAGLVLDAARAGDVEGARRLLAPGGELQEASDRLLEELRLWSEEGPADRVQKHPGVGVTSPRVASATAPR